MTVSKSLVGGCERLTEAQTPCSTVPIVAIWTHPEHTIAPATMHTTGQQLITRMRVCARCDHTISNVMARRKGTRWTREEVNA